MKIGIISFAHMHAHSYAQAVKDSKKATLVGIADENQARGKQAAHQYQTDYFSSYEELLNQDIDAVIVTSENNKHQEHVIASAKAKKHILCEKPLATTIEAARNIIEEAEENGVILQTAFPVRFHSAIISAKQKIDEGAIGRIAAILGTNRGRNPGDWFVDREKSGGGAVLDHTVHVVDIMRWYLQSEIVEVYAEIDQHFSEYDIDDAGVLTYEFDNGVYATLDCSWSRNKNYPTWGDVTLDIIGTEGTINVDVFKQNIHVYSDANGLNDINWGDDMDKGLIDDFIDAVIQKRPPSITGDDGLKAVEVALAAYKSSTIKEPVRIR
ncbi:Gfo/Idh/MocA family protein [Metabacillus arenae]|uniref:Gfo/Idh/MocA family oxidoreductase n=1 Tax=Metabacillus arenae TaxID=2771434 RepID=A0A926NGB8_9BACI|nr:Gfo/Idh/MocA family oxidoreductase [Metabacillus arenae]MBD1379508.1 Gfo/Idh/MocA family oxidoreductase [Metabacillus arenae]